MNHIGARLFRYIKMARKDTEELKSADLKNKVQTVETSLEEQQHSHIMCYRYSLTDCPSGEFYYLCPVSPPRLISGILVTGFRWEANQIRSLRVALKLRLRRKLPPMIVKLWLRTKLLAMKLRTP